MTPRDRAQTLFTKATQNLAVVEVSLDRAEIVDEVVGFHCQQAVEKFLKAVMAAHGIPFRRTHNLFQLMALLSDAGRAVPEQFHGLCDLTPFGVGWRYEAPEVPLNLDRPGTLRQIQDLLRWAEEQMQSGAGRL